MQSEEVHMNDMELQFTTDLNDTIDDWVYATNVIRTFQAYMEDYTKRLTSTKYDGKLSPHIAFPLTFLPKEAQDKFFFLMDLSYFGIENGIILSAEINPSIEQSLEEIYLPRGSGTDTVKRRDQIFYLYCDYLMSNFDLILDFYILDNVENLPQIKKEKTPGTMHLRLKNLELNIVLTLKKIDDRFVLLYLPSHEFAHFQKPMINFDYWIDEYESVSLTMPHSPSDEKQIEIESPNKWCSQKIVENIIEQFKIKKFPILNYSEKLIRQLEEHIGSKIITMASMLDLSNVLKREFQYNSAPDKNTKITKIREKELIDDFRKKGQINFISNSLSPLRGQFDQQDEESMTIINGIQGDDATAIRKQLSDINAKILESIYAAHLYNKMISSEKETLNQLNGEPSFSENESINIKKSISKKIEECLNSMQSISDLNSESLKDSTEGNRRTETRYNKELAKHFSRMNVLIKEFQLHPENSGAIQLEFVEKLGEIQKIFKTMVFQSDLHLQFVRGLYKFYETWCKIDSTSLSNIIMLELLQQKENQFMRERFPSTNVAKKLGNASAEGDVNSKQKTEGNPTEELQSRSIPEEVETVESEFQRLMEENIMKIMFNSESYDSSVESFLAENPNYPDMPPNSGILAFDTLPDEMKKKFKKFRTTFNSWVLIYNTIRHFVSYKREYNRRSSESWEGSVAEFDEILVNFQAKKNIFLKFKNIRYNGLSLAEMYHNLLRLDGQQSGEIMIPGKQSRKKRLDQIYELDTKILLPQLEIEADFYVRREDQDSNTYDNMKPGSVILKFTEMHLHMKCILKKIDEDFVINYPETDQKFYFRPPEIDLQSYTFDKFEQIVKKLPCFPSDQPNVCPPHEYADNTIKFFKDLIKNYPRNVIERINVVINRKLMPMIWMPSLFEIPKVLQFVLKNDFSRDKLRFSDANETKLMEYYFYHEISTKPLAYKYINSMFRGNRKYFTCKDRESLKLMRESCLESESDAVTQFELIVNRISDEDE